jgi:hypothetical protein
MFYAQEIQDTENEQGALIRKLLSEALKRLLPHCVADRGQDCKKLAEWADTA